MMEIFAIEFQRRREMTSSMIFVTVMVFVCTLTGFEAAGFTKSVNVAVRAKWEGTPFLLEAG